MNISLLLNIIITLFFFWGHNISVEYIRSNSFYYDQSSYLYDFLTIVSYFLSISFIYFLKKNIYYKLHFLGIFLVFIVGNYVKFFMILNWKTNKNQLISTIFAQLNSHLNDPDLLLEAYGITTITFASFFFSFILLDKINSKNIQIHCLNPGRKLNIDTKFYPQNSIKTSNKEFRRNPITAFSFIIWALNILSIYFQYSFRIGARTDLYGNGATYLPFKLAGLIHYSNTIFFPLISILCLLFISSSRKKSLYNIFLFLILTNNYLISSITTSKSPVIILFTFLFISWFLEGKFSKNRFIFILLPLLTLPWFLAILSYLRMSRSIGDIGNFQKIPEALHYIQNTQLGSMLLFNSFTLPIWRIDGIDTLVMTLNYFQDSLPEDIISKLSEFGYNIETFYKVAVMKFPENAPVGFSSGFTSTLYVFTSGSIPLFIISVFLFSFLVNKMFFIAVFSDLLTSKIAITQSIFFGTYSAASLTPHKLPYLILLNISIIILSELLFKTLLKST